MMRVVLWMTLKKSTSFRESSAFCWYKNLKFSSDNCYSYHMHSDGIMAIMGDNTPWNSWLIMTGIGGRIKGRGESALLELSVTGGLFISNKNLSMLMSYWFWKQKMNIRSHHDYGRRLTKCCDVWMLISHYQNLPAIQKNWR